MKRILLGLGGTPSADAKIKHAIDLAKRHEAEITGVTIVDASEIAKVGSIPIGGGPAANKLREHREHSLREHLEEAITNFRNCCEEAGVRYHIIREEGDPFEELVSLWRYHDITLLGLQGFFEYDVLDAPDDRVIKLIARGVNPIIASAKNYTNVKRAIIAYNGSMESAKAMKRFVQSRLWDLKKIQVVCCDMRESKAKQLLHDASGYCELHGYETETQYLDDSPRDVLLSHAEQWGADMIVLGSTNRGRIARFLLGDTVVHLIKNANIPLYLAQ